MRSFISLLFLLCISAAQASVLSVSNLRTEYKVNPMGLDVQQPRLSWILESKERNVMQTAYQIRAAGSQEALKTNPVWDTGWVYQEQSIHVPYQGSALKSGERVYWQVRVWDNHENTSSWSKPAWFETGLLNENEWAASWIQTTLAEDTAKSNPCPYFRKEIKLEKEIVRARVYITAHGLYELQINGRKAGDDLFTPGWTSYHDHLQVQTYDVTEHLQTGKNALGVILGDGWFRGNLGWKDARNRYGKSLSLLAQFVVEYSDGSIERFGTDDSWKSISGPILMSDIYNGECYDARLEMPGWSESGFDDTNWKAVRTAELPKSQLIAQVAPPVKKIEEIKPIQKIITPEGDVVFDMGQNMVGWVRLKVRGGGAGDHITLRHAEVLDSAGNFYTENLRSARAATEYILKGDGEEVYEPRFTFQGFRYVAVDGYPGEPAPDNLTGIVIHSDMKPTGHFTCSDSMINQLQHNIQWGQKGNFLDVPTDCPQRDERMGWTGDAHVFARTAAFNMDVASFYTKWLMDAAADQREDGAIPYVVPDVLGGFGSSGWGDAGVIIPWVVYQCYADTSLLQQQYDSMKAWVEFMKKESGENRLWESGFHFGDWLSYATSSPDYPGATTNKALISTAFFAYSTDILRKTAAVLGKKEDAADYAALLHEIKLAFQKEFVTPNGRLVSDTQTAYVLALAFELLPDPLIEKTAAYLADDVKKFKHLTTGFLGTPFLCHVLAAHGYEDLAFLLLNRKEYPSWLYPITQGATTIWERWDGQKPDGSFQSVGMNSFNHYAYGAIGDWLYRYVAGLEIDDASPAYKHAVIHPHPGGGLTAAEAQVQSVYGTLKSGWTVDENQTVFEVQVPANTRATVVLPGFRIKDIREGGRKLSKVKGAGKVIQIDEGVEVELGSGTYQFTGKQSRQH